MLYHIIVYDMLVYCIPAKPKLFRHKSHNYILNVSDDVLL